MSILSLRQASRGVRYAAAASAMLLFLPLAATAQERGGGREGGGGHEGGGARGGAQMSGARGGAQMGGRQMGSPRIEPQRAPQGYRAMGAPAGADRRPSNLNRPAFNHNFSAARSYRVGAYHSPAGWRYQRWQYGQILPRAYWAQQYWLSDYWLFGLDVPPVGYEWVRYGPDALLIDTTTGEVIQTVYGDFN
jgi:Ni/Co efflux regulator RcnB